MMFPTTRYSTIMTIVFFLTFSLSGESATAQDVIRGVNFVHSLQFGAPEHEAAFPSIRAASVIVIRFGLYEQNLD